MEDLFYVRVTYGYNKNLSDIIFYLCDNGGISDLIYIELIEGDIDSLYNKNRCLELIEKHKYQLPIGVNFDYELVPATEEMIEKYILKEIIT